MPQASPLLSKGEEHGALPQSRCPWLMSLADELQTFWSHCQSCSYCGRKCKSLFLVKASYVLFGVRTEQSRHLWGIWSCLMEIEHSMTCSNQWCLNILQAPQFLQSALPCLTSRRGGDRCCSIPENPLASSSSHTRQGDLVQVAGLQDELQRTEGPVALSGKVCPQIFLL